jgi:hypothetical protein
MNECVENITKVEWEHLVKHVAMLFRAGNDVRLAFREDDPPGTICMVDEVDYRIQYINHKGNPYLVDHETFCFQREINGPCTFKQVCNCFHIYITIKQPIEMIDFQAVIVWIVNTVIWKFSQSISGTVQVLSGAAKPAILKIGIGCKRWRSVVIYLKRERRYGDSVPFLVCEVLTYQPVVI